MLALTEITGVKGARARLLYQAGLRTPSEVARASREQLAEVTRPASNPGWPAGWLGMRAGFSDPCWRLILPLIRVALASHPQF